MDEELEMFVEAQDAVWEDVQSELRSGRKTTHWMWFVFPQLASLGQSPMSQIYGLHDLEEASAYLAHPVLGPRLIAAADLLAGHAGREAADILGETDALKLRSSMTLFEAIPGSDPVFSIVLKNFFDVYRAFTVA